MCHPFLFHSLQELHYISSLWILKKLYKAGVFGKNLLHPVMLILDLILLIHDKESRLHDLTRKLTDIFVWCTPESTSLSDYKSRIKFLSKSEESRKMENKDYKGRDGWMDV